MTAPQAPTPPTAPAPLPDAALRQTLEACGLIYWRYDAQLDQAWFSPRLAELLGVPLEDIPQRFADYLARLHPDDQPRLLAMAEASQGAAPGLVSLDYRIRHVDGRWLWIAERGQVTQYDIMPLTNQLGTHPGSPNGARSPSTTPTDAPWS